MYTQTQRIMTTDSMKPRREPWLFTWGVGDYDLAVRSDGSGTDRSIGC